MMRVHNRYQITEQCVIRYIAVVKLKHHSGLMLSFPSHNMWKFMSPSWTSYEGGVILFIVEKYDSWQMLLN